MIASHEWHLLLMKQKFKWDGQSYLLSDGRAVLSAGAAVEEEEDERDEDDKPFSVGRVVDTG